MNKVFCRFFNKEMERLKVPPFPGKLGIRIYKSISVEAWELWLKQQIKIINEYNLDLSISEHRKMILELLEKFLFFT